MKKCVAIGAGKEAIHAIRVAQAKGYYVYAIDGNKNAEGLAVADEAIVMDIKDINGIVDALKDKEILFLLPVPLGRWLTTYGAINEMLNLVGIGSKVIRKCVDKWEFHNCLNMYNLRNVKCKLINSKEKMENIDYFPCVFKPRFGSGSRLVFEITTKEELLLHAKTLDYCEDYLVEEKVTGTEYGLDAAVINGDLQIIMLRKKINTLPPVCQCIGYYSISMENKEIYDLVHRKVIKVISCLQLRDCIMHVDLIIQEDEVFVIEMSPRPSGHYCYDIFTPLCTGIDMVKEYINFREKNKFSFKAKYVQPMLIRFFDFSNEIINDVPNRALIMERYSCVVEYVCNIKSGDVMHQVKDGHSIIGRGYMILKGEPFFELENVAKKILGMFIRRPVNGL